MKNIITKPLLMGVFLIALSALLLEVNITRIFSVTLWYYFGFLAISLALLGTAAAGVLCYLYPDEFIGENYAKYLTEFSAAFAIFTPVAIYFHLNTDLSDTSVVHIKLYIILSIQLLLLFISFFCAAMSITIALFKFKEKIGTVYFSDLIGASFGCIMIVPLLYHFSAPSITFMVSTCACLAALSFSQELNSRWIKPLLGGLIAVFIILFLGNDQWGLLKVSVIKSFGTDALQTYEEHKVFEKWSPVSRVAVFNPKDKIKKNYNGMKYQTMKVTNDAAAPTLLHRFDGDFSKVDYMRGDSREIVHHLKSDAEVLIIGSGGGADVLTSLIFDQKKITAVEINPVTGELVRDVYADYIGNIFEDPRVTLHINEGRNFAAGSKELYDIVQITMIDSWAAAASGAYLFNENTLYTSEAVRDYYTHLKPEGMLSITRYALWDEALRLTNIFVQYLLDNGIKDVEKRLMVVQEDKQAYRRATVLLKNGIFTPEESALVVNAAKLYKYNVVYTPYAKKDILEPSINSRNIRSLIDPETYNMNREDFINSYSANIKPSTDDRPFFFFTKYFKDIFKTDPKDHAARRIALPFLYVMFISFGLFAVLTIFLPLYLNRNINIKGVPFWFRSLIYFVGLGVGFMLVEISLIQRLTIFLGHPTYSFVVALATILFASGIGSLFSSIWAPESNPKKLLVILASLIILILIYIIFLYDMFTSLMWLDKPVRILLAVFVMIPLGLLMGMCFPMGIQIVRKFHEHLVPWGWGVNGAFSVFASIFSLVIALNFGFKTMLAMGLGFYVLSLLAIYSIAKSKRVI